MKKYFFISCIIIIQSTFAGLPEFSTPKCAKEIELKVPDLDSVSGHFWDIDCSTLYIKPPKNGKLVFTSSFVSNEIDSCKDYSFWNEMKAFYQNEVNELRRKSSESMSSQEKKDHLLALAESLRTLERFMVTYNGFHEDSKDLKPIRMKFELDSKWSQMVDQYRNINGQLKRQDGKGISFEKLPVQASFINASFFSGKQSLAESDQDVVLNIPGVQLSDGKYSEVGISNLNNIPILFGEYLTGVMDLSLTRSCSLVSNLSGNVRDIFLNHKSIKDLNNSLLNSGVESSLAFSATYSYPLHLNVLYKVELSSAKIKKITDSVISKLNNTVHPSEIFNKFINSEISDGIKIIMISEDVRTNLSLDDERTLRNEVIGYLTENLMNMLKEKDYEVEPVSVAHFPNKVAYNEWQRKCKKRAWGLYKTCKNVLVTKTKDVLSKEARNELVENFSVSLIRETTIKNTSLFFTNQTF